MSLNPGWLAKPVAHDSQFANLERLTFPAAPLWDNVMPTPRLGRAHMPGAR